MTVNVSKPVVNVREKLAELDKPTGIAGEAMLRAETPQEQFQLIGAGRRNLIINGAAQVAQRGTSASYGVGDQGYKTVDRWRFNVSGNVDQFAATASQDTDAPAGFSNSIKTLVTTAETGIGGGDERTSVETRIEAQDLQMLNYGTSDAQGMTLSFWVKSNVTGKFSVNFRAHDAGDSYNTPYYINSAGTWEYKTVYIKGNTLSGGGISNDNGIGIWVRFMLFVSADQRNDSFTNKWVAGSTASYGPTDMQSEWGLTVNDYFQVTGVQLELGKVATPFEHRSYGEELALCQRYYQKTYNIGSDLATATYVGAEYGDGAAGNTSISFVFSKIKFRGGRMRANPTITTYDTSGNLNKVTRDNFGVASQANVSRTITDISDETALIYSSSGDAAQQLAFHYTLEAEL